MRRIIRLFFVTCVVFCFLFLTACSDSDKLQGTWEGQVPVTVIGVGEPYDVETKVEFTFHSDGTGSYKMQRPDALELSKDDLQQAGFDYEISDGILILTFGSREKEKYEYQLNEDTLSLSGNGKDYSLTRKK